MIILIVDDTSVICYNIGFETRWSVGWMIETLSRRFRDCPGERARPTFRQRSTLKPLEECVLGTDWVGWIRRPVVDSGKSSELTDGRLLSTSRIGEWDLGNDLFCSLCTRKIGLIERPLGDLFVEVHTEWIAWAATQWRGPTLNLSRPANCSHTLRSRLPQVEQQSNPQQSHRSSFHG